MQKMIFTKQMTLIVLLSTPELVKLSKLIRFMPPECQEMHSKTLHFL